MSAHDIVVANTILLVVSGSRAYGTAVSGSDTDYRGVFIAPPPMRLGLNPVPELKFDAAGDHIRYELGTYVKHVLSGSMPQLELLFLPDDLVSHADPGWHTIRAERDRFLSQEIARKGLGYVSGMLKRAVGNREREAPLTPGVWKEVGHAVRVARVVAELLQTGRLNAVRTGIDADELVAIRLGRFPLDSLIAECERRNDAISAALETTALPEHPDRAWAETLLVTETLQWWAERGYVPERR